MKHILFYINMVFLILLYAGCSEYEVIDSKPGESIDPVSNLQAIEVDNTVVLTWNLPSSFPDDIILPVSVVVQVYVSKTFVAPALMDLSKTKEVTLTLAPETYTYTEYDPAKTYVFVVKVKGDVDGTKYENPKYQTANRFSPGVSVTL